MSDVLRMSSAFIGVIVGAGFASGQEILQYFTSFGIQGIWAVATASVLFAFLGMTMTRLGSRLGADSHKTAVRAIGGRFLGSIADYIIMVALFGGGTVMIAGGGSIVSQQFSLPPILGGMLLAGLVILVAMFNVDQIVSVIGGMTPFLILAVVLAAVWSLTTMEVSFTSLHPIALTQQTTMPNWFVSGINYVSFNIAVGFSMSLVMGGAERDVRKASLAGLIGGLGIGVLILLSYLAIFANVKTVGQADMPMLKLINDISPSLGAVMALILICMMFNTALSMFFSLAARVKAVGTPQFKQVVVIAVISGFAASLIGFSDLVFFLYPVIGYLGLFLIIALIVSTFRKNKPLT